LGQYGSTRKTSSRYCSGSSEWSLQEAMIEKAATALWACASLP
jgi:hypothetical protein